MRRRAVLIGGAATGLVGLGSACTRPAPAIERAFVGQDPERGHLLREASARARTPKHFTRCDILVVGSGVAGASAAWRIARATSCDLVMLELESQPGGTARHGTMERSAYPMGAHYLPAPHRDFVALETLLEDLGVVFGRDRDGALDLDPRYVARGPVERHRHAGRWYEGLYPAAGQTAAEAAIWERWLAHLGELDDARGPDGRRLFALPLAHSSTALRHLDAISMRDYLDQHGFTSWRLRWLVDYACRDDYGCGVEETSAFAGLHHFLARGLERDEDRPILTWPQGNAFLVERMLDVAGARPRLRLDTAVVAIDPDEGRVTAWDFATDTVHGFEAQVVLWAAPRFVLPRVLPPGRDPLPARALEYAPWLVASVEVAQPPTGFGAPLAWDNVQVGADHLGYVVATHDEPRTETRASTVLTYYEPLTGDPVAARQRLLSTSLTGWSAHVEQALRTMHPALGADVRRIHVARWGHGMVRPTPGSLFGPQRALAAAPIGRVLPCAADVGGLPLFEQAFAEGVRAAETALARLGRPAPALIAHG